MEAHRRTHIILDQAVNEQARPDLEVARHQWQRVKDIGHHTFRWQLFWTGIVTVHGQGREEAAIMSLNRQSQIGLL